jgi:transcriptional regulator with XRE-family HTH domain
MEANNLNMAYKNDNFVNTVELGRAIKRRREELGLSLRDVADVTNVSASTLSRIENGTGKPDADNIARLTGWLKMPIDRVMSKSGSGPRGRTCRLLSARSNAGNR